MATSAVMQSFLVSPITGVSNGVGLKRMIPGCYKPRQQRNANVVVRSMAEEKIPPPAATPPSASASSPPPPPPPPPPQPKVSTKFSDVLAFSGPAPERINGRLAMIGFVAAIAVELAKGEDLFAQISDGGIPWFVLTTAVLSAASLVPLFSGVTVESKSKGFMTSDAELWNGRFAMLGLVALAFTEYVKGGPFV